LDRRYPRLAIEETLFFSYSFLSCETLTLLHPRALEANLKVVDGRLQHELGFVGTRPAAKPFI
jgi:hypothetical protein